MGFNNKTKFLICLLNNREIRRENNLTETNVMIRV